MKEKKFFFKQKNRRLNEIKDNDWDLSINRYKEIVYEEIAYAAPTEIIKDIEALDQERNQALAALKEMLG